MSNPRPEIVLHITWRDKGSLWGVDWVAREDKLYTDDKPCGIPTLILLMLEGAIKALDKHREGGLDL